MTAHLFYGQQLCPGVNLLLEPGLILALQHVAALAVSWNHLRLVA